MLAVSVRILPPIQHRFLLNRHLSTPIVPSLYDALHALQQFGVLIQIFGEQNIPPDSECIPAITTFSLLNVLRHLAVALISSLIVGWPDR